MKEEQNRLPAREVSLGCGTLVLIGIIVWFVTDSSHDQLDDRLRDVQRQLEEVQRDAEKRDRKLDDLEKKIDQLLQRKAPLQAERVD